MADSKSIKAEVMLININELGREGFQVAVYDTRPDEDATFRDVVEPSDDDADEDWRAEAKSLDASYVAQYINHEWRNASVEYTEEGLIKSDAASALDRIHETIIVEDPSSLAVRIEALADAFHVTVEADGLTRYETTLSHTDLGLETHPALRE